MIFFPQNCEMLNLATCSVSGKTHKYTWIQYNISKSVSKKKNVVKYRYYWAYFKKSVIQFFFVPDLWLKFLAVLLFKMLLNALKLLQLVKKNVLWRLTRVSFFYFRWFKNKLVLISFVIMILEEKTRTKFTILTQKQLSRSKFKTATKHSKNSWFQVDSWHAGCFSHRKTSVLKI